GIFGIERVKGLNLPASPILSLYLDWDEMASSALKVIPSPLCYMVGGEPFHYIYRTPEGASPSLALIADAATCLDGMSVQQICGIGMEQLRQFFPQLQVPPPLRFRIVKE